MSDSKIFFSQIRALTLANLKSRYRKTAAGLLWVVMNPLLTFGVQALVFGHFIEMNIDNYFLYLVAGLIPWIFISQTLEMTSSVFVASGALMKSFPASPLVYLWSQVADNIVNFLVGFTFALIPVWIFSGGVGWQILLLPIPILILTIGVMGLSWLLAICQVFFRDTRFVINFALRLGFFLTPIFYSKETIPLSQRWIVEFNPFYRLIAPFQILIHDFQPGKFAFICAAALTVAISIFGLATWLWRTRRNLVYLYV